MIRSGGIVRLTGLLAALILSSCAQTPGPDIVTPPPAPQPVPTDPAPPPPPQPAANPVPQDKRLSTLPGWEASDAFIALEALRATCTYKGGQQYAALCAELERTEFDSPAEIKSWLDSHLVIERQDGQGLLTGYFVPEYEATYTQDAEFSQPVRSRPADLVIIEGAKLTPPSTAPRIAARRVGDQYVPYYARAEIETWPADSRYFMRPEDYFFMQLQGSGFLTLPDGQRIYAAYAADNGRPFTGIARVMVERGYLPANQTSGDNIHAWLAAHRGPEAQEVMNANARYAFFAIQDRTEPVGAAGIGLPPGSAIAVDPTLNTLGDLFWIDADAGTLKDLFPTYQRMVAALDTGGAIKGKIRADLYLGIGKRAGTEAGRIKHDLRMWRIVPYIAD